MAGLAATGGDAKRLVASGLVCVNAAVERRRGHKLVSGDIVEVQGAAAQVVPGSRLKRMTDPGGPVGPGSPGG